MRHLISGWSRCVNMKIYFQNEQKLPSNIIHPNWVPRRRDIVGCFEMSRDARARFGATHCRVEPASEAIRDGWGLRKIWYGRRGGETRGTRRRPRSFARLQGVLPQNDVDAGRRERRFSWCRRRPRSFARLQGVAPAHDAGDARAGAKGASRDVRRGLGARAPSGRSSRKRRVNLGDTRVRLGLSCGRRRTSLANRGGASRALHGHFASASRRALRGPFASASRTVRERFADPSRALP